MSSVEDTLALIRDVGNRSQERLHAMVTEALTKGYKNTYFYTTLGQTMLYMPLYDGIVVAHQWGTPGTVAFWADEADMYLDGKQADNIKSRNKKLKLNAGKNQRLQAKRNIIAVAMRTKTYMPDWFPVDRTGTYVKRSRGRLVWGLDCPGFFHHKYWKPGDNPESKINADGLYILRMGHYVRCGSSVTAEQVDFIMKHTPDVVNKRTLALLASARLKGELK